MCFSRNKIFASEFFEIIYSRNIACYCLVRCEKNTATNIITIQNTYILCFMEGPVPPKVMLVLLSLLMFMLFVVLPCCTLVVSGTLVLQSWPNNKYAASGSVNIKYRSE
jgi:hypothetical protein